MLDSLITSKTRLRMLIKFFINTANKGYLNGLANEFNESTNSIRKELNNLSAAGYLLKVKSDNKVIYNANKKIAIEVQGGQHIEYVKHFHGNRLKYVDQLKRDKKKLDFCEINDIKLVEIYPQDVVNASFFEDQEIYL